MRDKKKLELVSCEFWIHLSICHFAFYQRIALMTNTTAISSTTSLRRWWAKCREWGMTGRQFQPNKWMHTPLGNRTRMRFTLLLWYCFFSLPIDFIVDDVKIKSTEDERRIRIKWNENAFFVQSNEMSCATMCWCALNKREFTCGHCNAHTRTEQRYSTASNDKMNALDALRHVEDQTTPRMEKPRKTLLF